jgi:hypothetical protein
MSTSTDDSQYQMNIIKHIIDECGPRLAGSEQEHKGSQLVGEEFTQINGSFIDDVHPALQ